MLGERQPEARGEEQRADGLTVFDPTVADHLQCLREPELHRLHELVDIARDAAWSQLGRKEEMNPLIGETRCRQDRSEALELPRDEPGFLLQLAPRAHLPRFSNPIRPTRRDFVEVAA